MNPPRWPLKFFRWFCHPDYVEDIEGDLLERFETYRKDFGERSAKRRLRGEVFRLFRPGIIRPLTLNNSLIHPAMIKHNLLIAFRSNLKDKGTFAINLIGMSTGLASVLLIYLWVADELSVDKFHQNDSQLYQVMENQSFANVVNTTHETSAPLADALESNFPEVIYTAAVIPSGWHDLNRLTLSVGEMNLIAAGQYVGKDYFNIFSFRLLDGDPNQVLNDKNAMVISEELAMQLFNTTENLIGKEIELQHERTHLISGVFESPPANSSLQFDFVMSFDLYKDQFSWVPRWDRWGPLVYVLLKEGTDPNAFNKKIENLIEKQYENPQRQPFLTSFSENYLYGSYENGERVGGRIEYVRLFSIIALLILLIACINFMNLSTAKASRRLKEIGVKKTIGASRKTLISQFLGESTIIAFLSLVFAILWVLLLLPQFNQITEKSLYLAFNPVAIGIFLGVALISGLLAGSYPAIFLSNIRANNVLKGKVGRSMKILWVRRALVVLQFSLSLVLILGVWVVYKQLQFVQTMHIGYEKNQVIVFDLQGRVEKEKNAFLDQIKRIPGIINASMSSLDMSGSSWRAPGEILAWEGKEGENIPTIHLAGVSMGFLETLDIEMVAGRPFSGEFRTDSSNLIFNEAAIELMGFQDSAIGRTVKFGGEHQIIGVMKNFHFESLHREIEPMLCFIAPGSFKHVLVRIEAGREQQALEDLQSLYTSFNPGFSLNYKFLDEDYQAFYDSEKRVSQLSKYFASLAILLSCLGMLGLSAYTTDRRTKEIGLRKIMGSSIWGIIQLLSKEFTQMVFIAILLGLPLSYFLASKWLENFAFKIDLELGYFLGAAMLTLLLAWFTVAFQTYKAASLNPVACLKDE